MSALEGFEGVALVDELRVVAAASGLDRIGVCDASILERARTELHRRKDDGLSDTMQFTFRNPERSTDPTASMADVRSIVVGARSYVVTSSSGNTADQSESSEIAEGVVVPTARVAKYAQHDFYSALRAGLENVASVLRRHGFSAIVVADENNLVDREVAYRAGIGWYGKNANLLLPGAGSWFVLGSVLTNAELPTRVNPVTDGCGQCRRCIDACPTGAIVAEGVIDARKCLAWLLQKPGSFPREFRVDLGDRIYGCDDCQDSCPITVRLGPRHGAGLGGEGIGVEGGGGGGSVDVLDLLESSDADLMDRFGRW
ncbi:MAG: tRNA epoxyqueuosine(34) reductase QueG, partial [Actinomycetota bacterium]